VKVPLANLAETKENEIKEISFFDRSVLLTQVGDVYNAFVNVCTHAGGPLLLEGGWTALSVASGVLRLKKRQTPRRPWSFPAHSLAGAG